MEGGVGPCVHVGGQVARPIVKFVIRSGAHEKAEEAAVALGA